MLAKKLVVSIGVLVVLGLPAIAEDAVKTTPSQIVVTGEHCPRWACGWWSGGRRKEARRLVLMSPKPDEAGAKKTDKPKVEAVAQSIRIVSLDLDRKDSQFVFSAKQIAVDQPGEIKLLPGQALPIPLAFQLGESAASGEYAGNLLIQHDKGDLLVPVTVKLRDPWWIAAGVLGFGVGLASVLSFYQAEGFDRDEVRSNMDKLRKRVQKDMLTGDADAVAQLFKARVKTCLDQVETHLEEKRWEDGRKGLKEAQAVWSRWDRDQGLWVELWKYAAIGLKGWIGQGAEQIPEDSDYARQVGLSVEEALQGMTICETPEKFRQSLEPIAKSIQRYFEAKAQLDLLSHLRSSLGDEWKSKVGELRRRLEALSPKDDSAYQAWQAEGRSLEAEMRQAGSTAGRDGARAIAVRKPPQGAASQGSGEVVDPGDGGAGWRLWLDETVKRLAFVGFMCGLGFSQVYAGNATFGANPGADYYGLLAWGFGAEATRDGLAKALQRKSKGGEK
jgi:hypothetical protein